MSRRTVGSEGLIMKQSSISGSFAPNMKVLFGVMLAKVEGWTEVGIPESLRIR